MPVLLLVSVHENLHALGLDRQTLVQSSPHMEENAQFMHFEEIVLGAVPSVNCKKKEPTSPDKDG